MNVKNVRMQLDGFGKPVISFDAVPETDLERDALKAMGWHYQQGMEPSVNQSLKVQPEYNAEKDTFRIWTFWQKNRGP